MSFNPVSKRNNLLRTLVRPYQPILTPYVRSPSWAALPVLTDASIRFVGLHAVYPDSNFLALSAAGAYTVDWGDGTATENIATGIQANHTFDYNAAGLADTNAPVTFTDAGDTVNRTAHGYTDGMTISFYSITTTTGIVVGQIYYVVGAAANTFQVSATSGGSAIALTTNGTGIILPYKQAVVSVIMQGGQTFTSLNLFLKNTTTGLSAYNSGFLDIAVAGASLTSLTIGSSAATIRFANLEQVTVYQNAVTSWVDKFYNCWSLQSVVSLYTNSATNMTSMFYNCYALQTLPLFNTAIVNTMYQMFYKCNNLQTVPSFNTVAVTSMYQMFFECRNLRIVPLFNTAEVNNMSGMFYDCNSLQTVPLFNTIKVTTMYQMFQRCYALQTVPLFNTILVSNPQLMFADASSLETVPLFNMVAATNMTAMFSGCRSLITVPLFNTAEVNNMTSMFNNCYSLITVPLFNTVKVTTMFQMFQNCYSLQTVPLFNTILVTDLRGWFNNCRSLVTVPLFNTIVVTNMTQMFYQCYSLKTVPLFNTIKVETMDNMFFECFSLQTVPLFNMIINGSMNQMFYGCSSLITVPLFNTVVLVTVSSVFQNCYALQTIPAMNVSAGNTFSNAFINTNQLSKNGMLTIKWTHSYDSSKLSQARLEEIFTNLGTSTAPTITITGNYGTVTPVSLASTLTYGSATAAMASTTGLATGMYVTGSGVSVGMAVTFQDAGDTVTKIAHGIPNDTPVSFTVITTTTGISINTTYYVVGTAADTFQVSLTVGGAAIALTTNGTGTIFRAVTMQDAGDTVTSVAHGIPNDTPISFARIASTTGIIIGTRYYVISTAANTFQLSTTVGGGAIALTTNGTGVVRYGTTITAIVTNVSATLSIPASIGGTSTLASRLLNISIATLKSWTVTG